MAFHRANEPSWPSNDEIIALFRFLDGRYSMSAKESWQANGAILHEQGSCSSAKKGSAMHTDLGRGPFVRPGRPRLLQNHRLPAIYRLLSDEGSDVVLHGELALY